MTPDLRAADRAEAVRDAARSWQRAGILDAMQLAAVERRYPDDRVRVGRGLREMLFFFTCLAVGCGFFFFAGFDNFDAGIQTAMMVTGVLLALATDVQISWFRRREGGSEPATAFLAALFVLIALFQVVDDAGGRLELFFLLAAVLLAAAAWRWGYPLFALLAAAAFFLTLARLPGARTLWIAVSLAAAPLHLHFYRSPDLAPADRESQGAAAFVAIAALYLAVHLGSWDAGLIESLRTGSLSEGPPLAGEAFRWIAAAMTALVPAALLALGVLSRHRLLLHLGFYTTVLSFLTLRYYVHLGPLWLVLTVAGTVLLAVVLLLRRWLAAGPDGERRGFTAAPLFTDLDRQRMLDAAAAATVFAAAAPDARTIPAGPQGPGVKGGGGDFGGGGASGSF